MSKRELQKKKAGEICDRIYTGGGRRKVVCKSFFDFSYFFSEAGACTKFHFFDKNLRTLAEVQPGEIVAEALVRLGKSKVNEELAYFVVVEREFKSVEVRVHFVEASFYMTVDSCFRGAEKLCRAIKEHSWHEQK